MDGMKLKIGNRETSEAVWVTLADDSGPGDLRDACTSAGLVSDSDDYYILESEGFNGMLEPESSLEDVALLLEMVIEHDEEVVKHVLDCCYGIDNISRYIDAHSHGLWDSEADFVRDLYSDNEALDALPRALQDAIDYQAAWDSDLRHDFVSIDVGVKVHIFSN
jgi:antirestriction protein